MLLLRRTTSFIHFFTWVWSWHSEALRRKRGGNKPKHQNPTLWGSWKARAPGAHNRETPCWLWWWNISILKLHHPFLAEMFCGGSRSGFILYMCPASGAREEGLLSGGSPMGCQGSGGNVLNSRAPLAGRRQSTSKPKAWTCCLAGSVPYHAFLSVLDSWGVSCCITPWRAVYVAHM